MTEITDLCFDDGPCELTGQVLDILWDRGVKATFALVGEKALAHPEMVRRIARDGHAIANHTMTHARLTDKRCNAKLEIDQCGRVLQEIGVDVTALRPPFSASDERVEKLADERGLLLLAASSVGDYLYDNEQELVHAARGYRGRFLGLHDTHEVTVRALPAILAVVR